MWYIRVLSVKDEIKIFIFPPKKFYNIDYRREAPLFLKLWTEKFSGLNSSMFTSKMQPRN